MQLEQARAGVEEPGDPDVGGAELHYLTSYDIVWVNQVATGDRQQYDYVRLEACMGAQYGYVNSTHTLAQAGSFMAALLSNRPFSSGNRRTALLAALTFLVANGLSITAADEELARAVAEVDEGHAASEAAVGALTRPGSAALPEWLTLRALVSHLANRHSAALKLLAPGD